MLTSTHSYLSDDKALKPKEGESIDDVDAEYSCSRKRRSSCLQTESSEHEPSIPYDRLSALVSAIEDVDSNTVLDSTDDAEIFSTASLSSSTGPNVKLPSLASLCASIQAPTAAMTEEFNQKVADSMKENSNDSQHVQPNGFMSWYMNSMSRYKNYMAAYAAYYQAYKYALACQAQNSNVKAPKSPIFPQSREDKSTIQEEKRRRLGSKAGDHSNLCPIKPNIFPPSTIRPAEEPIFTGRYGHDDLLKAYMRPKSASKAFNQQSFATSEIMNRLGNDPKPSDNLASKYYHNSSTTLPSNPVKESRSGDLSKDSEMDDDSRDEDSDQEHSSPQPSFDRPKKYNYEKEMSEHRSAHTLAERRRRKEMKKLFDQLKVLLPGYSNLDRQRLSKWDILSGTVEVIDELSERRSALLAKKQYLVSLLSKSSESVDPSTVSNS